MSNTCIDGGQIYRDKTSPYSKVTGKYSNKTNPYSRKTAVCPSDSFLLLNTGDFFLLNTGDKIILQ